MTFMGMSVLPQQAVAAAEPGTASISGTVTANVPDADLANVQVTAYLGEDWVNSGWTDEAGNFTIGGLDSGEYRLQIDTWGTPFVAHWYGGSSFETATVITLSPGESFDGLALSLEVGAQIVGQLSSDHPGADFSSLSVFVHSGSDLYVGDTFSSNVLPDGSFRVRGLPAGSYRLQVITNNTEFVGSWFGGGSFDDAEVINLNPGEVRSGADVALVVGAQLTGTVSWDKSLTVDYWNVNVQVWPESGSYPYYASVDVDGSFAVRGLPAGSYRVQITAGGTDLMPRWLGGDSFDTAEVIELELGGVRSGLDIALQVGARISGQLSSENDGYDYSGVQVTAYSGAAQYLGEQYFGSVEADGSFEVRGLPAGSYRIYINDSGLDFVPQWVGGDSFDTAQVFSLEPQESVVGVDAVLASGAEISGQLSSDLVGADYSNLQVVALSGSTRYSAETFYGTIEADGAFTVRGLPAGSYRLEITAWSSNFLGTWFGGTSFDTATAITLGAGETRTGIEVPLALGAQITGKLTSALPDADYSAVNLYVSGNVSRTALVDADGNFVIQGLPAGSYQLRVDSGRSNFVSRYFGGDGSFSTAESIGVEAGEVHEGIVIALTVGGKISGQLTSPVPGFDYARLSLMVRPASNVGWINFGATISKDGSFEARGLPTGSYYVGVGTYGTNLVEAWYGGASYDQASVVSVEAGETTPNVNIALMEGGRITGNLTSTLSTADFSGITVMAYGGSNEFAGPQYTSSVSPSGGFVLQGLPTGAYRVKVSGQNSDFVDAWYGGTSFGSATAVEVIAGESYSFDIPMELGGSVSGRVTLPSGEPASNALVSLFDGLGPFTYSDHYSTSTNGEGVFTIRGIEPGDYRILFDPTENHGLKRVWLGGTSTFENATVVSLTRGEMVDDVDVEFETSSDVEPPLAPQVQVDLTGTVPTVSWDKPSSEEPIIGYTFMFRAGDGFAGMSVIGEDVLSADIPAGFAREGEATLVSVAALTPSHIGAFGSAVADRQSGNAPLGDLEVELIESSSTSLTFRAAVSADPSLVDLLWIGQLDGEPNHRYGRMNYDATADSSGVTLTFTDLKPGKSYDFFVIGYGAVGATEWAVLRGQTTLKDDPPVTPGEPTDPPVTPGEPTDPPVTPGEPTDPPVTPGEPTDPPVTPGEPTDPPVTPGTPAAKTTPVYRFWSEAQKGHFYTASAAERDHILKTYPKHVWQYETVAYQAFAKQQPGTVPLYRFWSDAYQGHFFTASAAEKDLVVRNYDDSVWKYEGIAYYVYPARSDVANAKDVFRFWGDVTSRHFYTASAAEKNHVIATYDRRTWTYETVGYRVPTS